MISKGIVVILAVAAAVTGVATAVVMSGNSDDSGRYDIEYELNGGEFKDDYPDSYKAGEITELGVPHKTYTENGKEEEYVFLGWYLDPGFKDNILYISSEMKQDVKLYASWSKDGSNAQESFNISTTTVQKLYIYGDNKVTTTGTYDRTYLKYDETNKKFLEKISYTNTDALGRTTGNTVTRWQEFIDTDQDDEELTPKDATLELNGRTISCQSVEFTYDYGEYKVTETRYFIYGWAMLYSQATYRATNVTISETYELRSLGTYSPSSNYNVTVYGDMGITVTGGGSYPAFTENVTLTATPKTGTTFAGWYDSAGNKVSDSTTYTIDFVASDMTFYAYNTVDDDVSVVKGNSYTFTASDLTNVQWSLTDSNGKTNDFSGNPVTKEFADYETYTVKYSGQDSSGNVVYGFFGLIVDSTEVRTYNWTYDGIDYTATLNIKYSDFYAYRSDSTALRQSADSTTVTTLGLKSLMTVNDTYVKSIATQIKNQTLGKSHFVILNVVLAFTQYIPYEYDSVSMGKDEYFKYPLETLFDNNGDCEDTSILFASIGKALGYNTAVMFFPGHAAGAVLASDLDLTGKIVPYDGVRYVDFDSSDYNYYLYNSTSYNGYLYCETTATGYYTGYDPNFKLDYTERTPSSDLYSPINMRLIATA